MSRRTMDDSGLIEDMIAVSENVIAVPEALLSLLPSFQTPHTPGKEPGGKTRNTFFDHLLPAMFLKLFQASGKGKTTVFVAITAISRTFGTVGFGSPTLGIFPERHSATLTKFMIFHCVNHS
jgi:hypothetical protein